ncbi:hypothetical protein SAY86_005509 [Trapa natans]|uniref:Uncharacterized protein n=1 Tax=Trapa natans TaxID=22666 RepID=A0AAN7QTJ0_TRANT|nr:hypothetical protein SAY86_005509 [Trapa natans]
MRNKIQDMHAIQLTYQVNAEKVERVIQFHETKKALTPQMQAVPDLKTMISGENDEGEKVDGKKVKQDDAEELLSRRRLPNKVGSMRKILAARSTAPAGDKRVPHRTGSPRILHGSLSFPSTVADIAGPESPQAETSQQTPARRRVRKSSRRGIFTNMWWADLKGAFGQRFNWGGIVCSVAVFTGDRHIALPHISVPEIRFIDWEELHRRGFKGVVFDKGNTIIAPYCLTLWGPIAPSIEQQCKSVFGSNIAVFSNSAGLFEYDHDGSRAKALEWAIAIKVRRHRVKKQAGSAEEIEKHFGCDSSQLIMVILGVNKLHGWVIVYRNRNGFLTILTASLCPTEEPFIVRQVRKLENSLVRHWWGRGLKPVSHRLLPDTSQCLKDPQSP